MREGQQIEDILIQWEELRRDGGEPAIDELCGHCSQLGDEVKKRVAIIEQMESVLGMRAAATGEWTPSASSPTQVNLPPELKGPDIPNHEVQGVLGRGGMGVVYKARQTELGRTVAIKMIDRSIAGPIQLSRFRDEARAIARLNHPNIVQIFEFGQAEGDPFFSMEFVDGGNLKDRLTAGPLQAREAVGILETIARAIHVAHEHGFIHRDLKPANILLTSQGEPKVTDFGLVKHLHEESGHTKTGDMLGTFGYMAPEQVDNGLGDVDVRTDVYALGAILYHLLTGRPVFDSSPAQALYGILHGDIKPPSQLRRGVPRDLDAICMMCLERRSNRRYASAKLLADDLTNFLQHKPVKARRVSAASRAVKWMKRHRYVAAAAAIILTLLAVAPLLFALPEYRARAQLRKRAVQVAPQAQEILRRNCYQCHGLDTVEIQKDLQVLDHSALIDSERRIVVPGAPNESRLMQRIVDGSMPPKELETQLPRLAEAEITILNEWILGGAPPFPSTASEESTRPIVPYSSIAAEAKTIFHARCYSCHKYDNAEGGINILHHRLLIHVRQVVVPDDPAASELYQLITSDDEDRVMPPAPRLRLKAEEIDVIRQWILAGAPPFPRSD